MSKSRRKSAIKTETLSEVDGEEHSFARLRIAPSPQSATQISKMLVTLAKKGNYLVTLGMTSASDTIPIDQVIEQLKPRHFKQLRDSLSEFKIPEELKPTDSIPTSAEEKQAEARKAKSAANICILLLTLAEKEHDVDTLFMIAKKIMFHQYLFKRADDSLDHFSNLLFNLDAKMKKILKGEQLEAYQKDPAFHLTYLNLLQKNNIELQSSTPTVSIEAKDAKLEKNLEGVKVFITLINHSSFYTSLKTLSDADKKAQFNSFIATFRFFLENKDKLKEEQPGQFDLIERNAYAWLLKMIVVDKNPMAINEAKSLLQSGHLTRHHLKWISEQNGTPPYYVLSRICTPTQFRAIVDYIGFENINLIGDWKSWASSTENFDAFKNILLQQLAVSKRNPANVIAQLLSLTPYENSFKILKLISSTILELCKSTQNRLPAASQSLPLIALYLDIAAHKDNTIPEQSYRAISQLFNQTKARLTPSIILTLVKHANKFPSSPITPLLTTFIKQEGNEFFKAVKTSAEQASDLTSIKEAEAKLKRAEEKAKANPSSNELQADLQKIVNEWESFLYHDDEGVRSTKAYLSCVNHFLQLATQLKPRDTIFEKVMAESILAGFNDPNIIDLDPHLKERIHRVLGIDISKRQKPLNPTQSAASAEAAPPRFFSRGKAKEREEQSPTEETEHKKQGKKGKRG